MSRSRSPGRVRHGEPHDRRRPHAGEGLAEGPFFEIGGPDVCERAFRLAHEVDPRATLLYNDYNEHNPGRRRFLVDVIRDYKRRGVPIHRVGFQGHVGLEYPDLAEYEKSLQAIAAEGLPVHISELDVDVLPRASGYTGAEISTTFELSEKLNPWKVGLPADIEARLTARYRQVFELFLKYRDTIARVTTWRTHDGESWKNNFPSAAAPTIRCCSIRRHRGRARVRRARQARRLRAADHRRPVLPRAVRPVAPRPEHHAAAAREAGRLVRG